MKRLDRLPDAQRQAIIEARLAGASIPELRQRFGLSQQEACWFSQRWDANPARFAAKCVYPNIARWIRDNGITQKELEFRTGIGYRALVKLLYGCTAQPQGNTIKAVLKATGMTYQEAFYKEENNHEE